MEGFFSIGLGFDSEIDILEFIYRRYSQADKLIEMPLVTFCGILQKGMEKETEERLHHQWTSMLPEMSLGRLKYISFEQYKNKCLGIDIDLRPTDEIISELESIHGVKLV